MGSMKYVLGIDIGGTNFRLGLVDEGRVLKKFNIISSAVITVNDDPLYNLKSSIEKFLKENLDGELAGIAIGVPSTVSKDMRIIYSTPNIKGFNNLNIVDYLENVFNLPVYLNRDVNYLMKFDMVEKKIEKDGTTLGFYIGTGVGNSIFIGGEFLNGKNGAAGELGHVPVMNSNRLCGCGNVGCMETHAAGRALSQIMEESFPCTNISDIFVKHGESDIIKEFVGWVSIPIATEINIFDPDNVIIGGGVIQMEGFPIDYFEKCVLERTRKPFPANSLRIQYSQQSQESGVIGAAYYAFEKLGL